MVWILNFSLRRLLLIVSVFAVSYSMQAQARASGNGLPIPSRTDVYATYGYFRPNNVQVNGQTFNPIYDPNITFGVNVFLTRHWGINFEAATFSATIPSGSSGCVGIVCVPHDQSVQTVQAGPIYRFNFGRLVPFLHATGGGVRTRGPALQPLTWGYGVTAGGGVDYVLPFGGNHLAIRPIQADYQYSHTDYGTAPSAAVANYYGVLDMPALKLSGGIVARFGGIEPPQPAALACEVTPTVVYPGDPVRIDPATVNLNPHKKTKYVWTTTGGQLTLSGEGADLSTANLAPGTYTVRGHVSQGGKRYQQADCTRDFTLRPFDPPTVACLASPASIRVGETATVTASGRSPQNRPLSYTFTSTSGQLNGQGNTRTLQAGTAGNITVNCTAVDDQGKTASATTTVSVIAPTPPPMPSSRTLCSTSFERDRRRPVRVDNEAKACLDEIALVMARESDATLILLGNYDTNESATTGAERSLNVSLYLKQDKGIDASRIQTMIGSQTGRVVDSILLPPGATNPALGARSFDPATIRSHGEPYGRKRVTKSVRKRRSRK